MILTGNANETRAIPGQRWGVGMSCKGGMEEEYTPDCSCPCHLAEGPPDAGNTYCDVCGSCLMRFSFPERERTPYPHERAVADGRRSPRLPKRAVADHYFLTNGNNLDHATRGRYKTMDAAKRAADKRNLADVFAERNIGPKQGKRAQAFHKLSEHSWCYNDDDYWWVRAHERYAVESYYEGDSSWSTHDTLEEVRAEIEGDDVGRVVDLDTGAEIPFSRTVSVAFAEENHR